MPVKLAASQGPSPGAINSELFARGKDNIAQLLRLLEDEPAGVNDLYVRYHTVQLLTALGVSSSTRLQQAHPGLQATCALTKGSDPFHNQSARPGIESEQLFRLQTARGSLRR